MRNGMAIFGVVVLMVIVLVVCGIVGTALDWFSWGATTATNSARGVVERTADPDNVLFNYEWFHDKYEYYNATTKKLADARSEFKAFQTSLPKDRADWTWDDKQEEGRLRSVVMALEQTLADTVTEYNSNSKKLNRRLFKSRNLPYRLEM